MKSPKKSIAALAALTLAAAVALPIASVHAADAPKADAKAPAFKAHVLNRAELDALFAKPESVLVIDVRRPDEATSIGSFPVYLSVQLADLEKSTAWISKERTLVLVSNHAGRAGALRIC